MAAAATDRKFSKRERTHVAIQTAALELFADQGFRETTLEQIAERAGVAPRTVGDHFPAKHDMLFASDPPFSLDALADYLAPSPDRGPTLDAVHEWHSAMIGTGSSASASEQDFWRRRQLRARIMAADETLRGLARAGYVPFERLIAASLAEELGQPTDAQLPRLVASVLMTGLREVWETGELRALGPELSTEDLNPLVDRVFTFAAAGLAALRDPVVASAGS